MATIQKRVEYSSYVFTETRPIRRLELISPNKTILWDLGNKNNRKDDLRIHIKFALGQILSNSLLSTHIRKYHLLSLLS